MAYTISYQEDFDVKDEPPYDEQEVDENDYGPPNQIDGTDEDTEEASETDMGRNDQPMEIKEQMYQDKLSSLKKQLAQLKDGSHPELNRRFRRLEHQYRERLRLNDVHRDYMVECVERDYLLERDAATKEFKEKKEDLKETLINDFEEKRRQIEQDRHSMELTGDSTEVKPVMTRKLRRRPNDPTPVLLEKRRKPPTAQLVLLLDDKEIEMDLKLIARGKPLQNLSNGNNNNNTRDSVRDSRDSSQRRTQSGSNLSNRSLSPANSNENINHQTSPPSGQPRNLSQNRYESQSRLDSIRSSQTNRDQHQQQQQQQQQQLSRDDGNNRLVDTRVEDGKLLYERRWYHRGQPIYVEGNEFDKQRLAVNISAINADAIWVKKQDGTKLRICTSQLSRGKVSIKRRAS